MRVEQLLVDLMPSTFPGALDAFATTRVDATVMAATHPTDHNNENDAINKIEAYLISSPNLQTGTAYTLVAADNGKVVSMNNAAGNTLTIPTNASVAFPVGTLITVRQAGAGQTNIIAAGGVTLNARGGLTHLAGQFAYAMLFKVATDTWDLSGDIA
jgi:hypothetical protein